MVYVFKILVIVAFVDMITCTLCFFIGTDRPMLKYLYRYVRTYICTQWYEIGIELLDIDDIPRLEMIRQNFPGDPSQCVALMLELWLERKEDASWDTLIRALRQPHIILLVLASKIENMLVKEEDISFKGMITVM